MQIPWNFSTKTFLIVSLSEISEIEIHHVPDKLGTRGFHCRNRRFNAPEVLALNILNSRIFYTRDKFCLEKRKIHSIFAY